MNFAFAVSYLTLEDDIGENPNGVENTLSLAGCAILSRLPLGRVENADLPELRDKFSSSEKRLGKKRALAAELLLPAGPLAIGCCHLDSNASPAQRAAQLSFVLDRLDALGAPRALVGGDWNTSTWDAASTGALVREPPPQILRGGLCRERGPLPGAPTATRSGRSSRRWRRAASPPRHGTTGREAPTCTT